MVLCRLDNADYIGQICYEKYEPLLGSFFGIEIVEDDVFITLEEREDVFKILTLLKDTPIILEHDRWSEAEYLITIYDGWLE